MVEDRVQRRLATVLAADVAGYSRLMGMDEESTLRTLQSYRAIIDRLLAHHEGRVVTTAGDSVLAEFASPVEAVRCAVAIQEELALRNRELVDERRMHFRIGINVGDVMVVGGDLLGDGVNIAARLEGLAEPGGICLSGSTYDQVKNKLPNDFEDIGPQTVKNIADPVPAYRLAPDKRVFLASPARPAPSRPGKRLVLPAIAILVLAVAAGSGVLLWSRSDQGLEPARIDRMAFPLPGRPSIAVLPFDNMSDDPNQEYFADGITEDLITDLSKISGLFVIARNSTFAYKGQSPVVSRVAEDLGVRYVLEGSVRRAGDQVRINVQLIDASTGGHLWADRYDGRLTNVFDLQDQVTRKIVDVLAVQLTQGEDANFAQRQTGSPEAYDEFLKGWDQYLRQTPDSLSAAVAHFERAVELDPDYARGHAALAAAYWQAARRFWHANFGYHNVHGARAKAEELLVKAQQQPTALSRQVAAAMLAQSGHHTQAIAEGGRAIAMDPNDADSYVALAGALNLAGSSMEARQMVQKAMRLNPHFPPNYLYELALAEFGGGNYAAAAKALERAIARNPEDRWSYRLLLATYGHLGRTQDAQQIIDVTSRNWRGHDPLTVRAVAYWYPFKNAADSERLADGLRKANVPE